MCSIIGISGSAEAAPLVVGSLQRMEYRGYDSAGMAAIQGRKIRVWKGVGKVAEVNAQLRLDKQLGTVAIGHTRWATHGGVTDANAHPHLSTFGRVAIVHNGIIENYEELREVLLSEGYTFRSETDSEVIANLLDREYARTGVSEEAVRNSIKLLKGKFAFVAMFSDGRLAAARAHEPLILGVANKAVYVASDVLGFAGQVDRVVYLENDEFAIVDSRGILLFDFQGSPVPHEVTIVAKELAEADKGRYVHFTLKEIYEQPRTILRAGSLGGQELSEAAKLLQGAKRVYLTGCGTSYHAALIGSHLLSEFTSLLATTVVSSEAKFSPVKYGPDTVLVALSQSGETADVLEAVEAAKDGGAKILSLVNVSTSSLARASDAVIALNCGPEVGVAATKSFTAEVATLYRLVELVSHGSFSPELDTLPGAFRDVLTAERGIREIAREMKAGSDIYVLGAGLNYYSALEASLKIKELAYVHAEALPAGELKHGPLALIDENALVIALNPEDDTYGNMLAAAHEVKSRGAKIIGVSDRRSDLYSSWIQLPKVSRPLYPLLEVLPMQLLAYALALERKANPDYPRNLAKSVTVK